MFAINMVQCFGGQIKSIRRGWSSGCGNPCPLVRAARRRAGCPGIGWFSLRFCAFSLSPAVHSLHLPFWKCSPMVYRSSYVIRQKYQHTWNVNLLFWWGATKATHTRAEVTQGGDLAAVRTAPCTVPFSLVLCAFPLKSLGLTEWSSKYLRFV